MASQSSGFCVWERTGEMLGKPVTTTRRSGIRSIVRVGRGSWRKPSRVILFAWPAIRWAHSWRGDLVRHLTGALKGAVILLGLATVSCRRTSDDASAPLAA